MSTPQVHLYYVTKSDQPGIEPGHWLVERSGDGVYTWRFWNSRDHDWSTVVGIKANRLCWTCFSMHPRVPAEHGHAEEHGQAPKPEARIPEGAQS